MILSDRSIKDGVAQGRITITPYDEAMVQPASRSGKMAKSRTQIRADYISRHQEQGLCTMCPNPVRDRRSRCSDCEKRRTKLDAERRLAAVAKGLCYDCRKSNPMHGHKLCDFCYCQSVSANRFKLNTRASGQSLLDKFHSQRGLCAISGAKMILGKDCDLDHIIPTSRGGKNTLDNTQWVLSACNRMKDNLLEEEEFFSTHREDILCYEREV